MNSILTSIIASTVIASIISSFVAYRLKTLDYKNEYYKIILNKRLGSYKTVEQIILLLQAIEYLEDGTPYHSTFFSDNYFTELRTAVRDALYQSLWLSSQTLYNVKRINELIISFQFDENLDRTIDILDKGIEQFKKIEDLKLNLEQSCRSDILHLHKLT